MKGDWKLGGFRFGISTKDESGADNGYEFPEYDSRLPRSFQRNLDFLGTSCLSMANGAAPEYVMDETVDNANDMFQSFREFLTFQVLSGLRYCRHP